MTYDKDATWSAAERIDDAWHVVYIDDTIHDNVEDRVCHELSLLNDRCLKGNRFTKEASKKIYLELERFVINLDLATRHE